jgi:guanine deaminase
MFEAMRLASFTSRVRGPDYRRWLATDEVFRQATEGSATGLGFSRIGRIAPGYKADVVFLDRRHMNYVPLTDVTNQIVNAEDATAVRNVMIGGRIVYQNGEFTTFDLDRLLYRAEVAWERLRAVNESARRLSAALEPVVGSFCSAMASRPYHVNRFVDDEEAPRSWVTQPHVAQKL